MYRIKFFYESVNQKNFLLQNGFSKWNLHSNTLETFLLQKGMQIISFWENINYEKDLISLYRMNPTDKG